MRYNHGCPGRRIGLRGGATRAPPQGPRPKAAACHAAGRRPCYHPLTVAIPLPSQPAYLRMPLPSQSRAAVSEPPSGLAAKR